MAKIKYRHDKATRKPAYLPYILLIIGIVIGLSALGVVMYSRAKQAIPPGQTRSNEPSSVKPSESNIQSHTVAPDEPRYITIPALSVGTTRVFQYGVNNQNQIIEPSNIYDVGWFNKSAKPGQAGAMFIYGHTSSWTANGVFHNLGKLRKGDTITITQGDGKELVYKVDAIKAYPHDNVDMKAVLAPYQPNTQGLNLMTCSGKVIKGTSNFEERLVVFTTLIQG